MEKYNSIISLLEKIEQHYIKLNVLTDDIAKSLLSKDYEELLSLLDRRGNILFDLDNLMKELYHLQKNFIDETKCIEFNLSSIKHVLSEQDFLRLSNYLERINRLLEDIIRVDQQNMDQLKILSGFSKKEITRINSVKGLRKAYSSSGVEFNPLFLDFNK